MPDNSEPLSYRPYVSRFSQAEMADAQNQNSQQGDGTENKAEPHKNASLLEDFGRSLVHTVIQSPANALVQPFDKTFGTNVLPSIQFIEAPQHAEFGTANYWAQQSGSAIGMLGTFWGVGKGVKAFTRAGQTEAMLANTLSRQTQIGLTLKEATLTGFVHDFALRPVEEGDKRNYFIARLGNGVIGGATMLTLAGTGVGLKHLGGLASVEKSALLPVGENVASKMFASTADKLRFNVAAPLLKSDIVAGGVSAIPAGFVSANMHTFLQERRLATARENFETITTMGVIGMGLGAHQQFRGRHESGRQNFEWSSKEPSENGRTTAEFKIVGGEKALTEAVAKVREGEGAMVKVREHLGAGSGWKRVLGLQEYGPKKDLFIQHNDAVKGINYDAARMADVLAICQLDAAMQSKSAVVGKDVTLVVGKDRVRVSSEPQEVKEGFNKPIKLGDHVQNYSNNMQNLRRATHNTGEESSVNDIVRHQLRETGLEAKGWKSAVTEQGSAMDMIGADIVIFNQKTGQMYMLDCTEQAKNPPAIRSMGIIQIQKSWFRANSRGPDMPDSFPAEVGQILMKATGEAGGLKPTLNLRDVQLPSIKAGLDVEKLAEMRQFVHELERLPSDANFRGNKTMVQDYAKHLKDTTLDHLEWAVHGSSNKEVTRTAVDVAKDSIVEYFINGKQHVNANYGETDVFVKHDNVSPEKNELRFRSTHGDRVVIGKVESIFEQARKELLPLSSARAKQVETAMEGLRAEVKVKEAVIESIQEKRQKAQSWDELLSLNAELRIAREDHAGSVAKLKQWAPENSLIQRIKKNGKTISEFEGFLMRDQAAIRNGGRVGLVDASKPGPLEQLLRNNLTHKQEDFLFRNTLNGERPLKPFEEAGLSSATAKDLNAAVSAEWGVLELKPGAMDERVALSLSIFAETNPTVNKLVEGYEKGEPEAIRIVHRLLTER